MTGCAVCGDRVNGSRYGAPACLGCIVFFRRAVCKKAQYRCLKDLNCTIDNESRCVCRFCRFQKCVTVGMRAEAIQRRDVMGPRKKRLASEETPPSPVACPSVASTSSGTSSESLCPPSDSMVEQLMRLQQQQRRHHFSTAAMLDDTLEMGSHGMFDAIDNMVHCPEFRRARKRDVNFMLRTGLMDAAQWAAQFTPFKRLQFQMKKSILTEFGLAFTLVDQGAISSSRSETDLWMLQNNTYMTPDYMRGLPEEDHHDSQVPAKVKLHPIFVQDAIDSVCLPMRRLQIDAFECAVIKTVLLLSHKNLFGTEQKEDVERLQSKLVNELMEYCTRKNPSEAIERTGTVLLLTTSIRCSIRSLYDQTRVSDIFNLMTFNSLIRDVYLT